MKWKENPPTKCPSMNNETLGLFQVSHTSQSQRWTHRWILGMVGISEWKILFECKHKNYSNTQRRRPRRMFANWKFWCDIWYACTANGALASPPQHTHCFRLQSFFTREVSRARANILLPRGYGGNSSSIANRDGDEHSIPGRSFIFSILPLFSRSVVIHLFVHSAFFFLFLFLNSHYECRLDIWFLETGKKKAQPKPTNEQKYAQNE